MNGWFYTRWGNYSHAYIIYMSKKHACGHKSYSYLLTLYKNLQNLVFCLSILHIKQPDRHPSLASLYTLHAKWEHNGRTKLHRRHRKLDNNSFIAHFIKSRNTKPFQRLWSTIDANRLRDLAKTPPITTPRNINGNTLCTLKCASANAAALSRIDHGRGMYRVRDGRRKPRNTISSHIGAHTVTTTAYKAIATGSRATMDCSTLDTPATGPDDIWTRLMLMWESKFTSGNNRHPNATSQCHLPFNLNSNQPGGRGRNLPRHWWRIAIPARSSVMSVTRLYNAWPLCVNVSLLKPAAWAKNGTIQEPTSQNVAIHKNMTCFQKV